MLPPTLRRSPSSGLGYLDLRDRGDMANAQRQPTALMIACSRGYVGIVTALVQHGVDKEVGSRVQYI